MLIASISITSTTKKEIVVTIMLINNLINSHPRINPIGLFCRCVIIAFNMITLNIISISLNTARHLKNIHTYNMHTYNMCIN